METLGETTLDKTNKKHLCAIINTYGTEDHPWATDDSLRYFAKDYIKECLDTAWEKNDHIDRRRIITQIREVL